jgi:hypothetical protein
MKKAKALLVVLVVFAVALAGAQAKSYVKSVW